MTTATATRTCPDCGSGLNRLTNKGMVNNLRGEGWAVQPTFRAPGALRHRSAAEWRAAARRTETNVIGAIHTCPKCEYAETEN